MLRVHRLRAAAPTVQASEALARLWPGITEAMGVVSEGDVIGRLISGRDGVRCPDRAFSGFKGR